MTNTKTPMENNNISPKSNRKRYRNRTKKPVLSNKELATKNGQPYIEIVSFKLDDNNLHQGSFELDWNDKFLSNLVRAGYQMSPNDTDAAIVDRWFQNICRHVVLETWEQYEANHTTDVRPIRKRNIGDGFSEVS